MNTMTTTSTKCYRELQTLHTFEERFEYLKLGGGVGRSTFGFDRFINQAFYGSREWKQVREHVLIRDNGCDLGIEGYEIHYAPMIHHMNPMTVEDLVAKQEWVLEPEFLITTTHNTHNNIHFGGRNLHPRVVLERKPNDTRLW